MISGFGETTANEIRTAFYVIHSMKFAECFGSIFSFINIIRMDIGIPLFSVLLTNRSFSFFLLRTNERFINRRSFAGFSDHAQYRGR